MIQRIQPFITFALVLLISHSAATAWADGEPTRPTNPNAISMEILGRGLRYSLNYDRALNDDFVAGVGFGSSLVDNDNGTATDFTAKTVPLYLNYYLWREAGSVFGSAGIDFVMNPRDIDQRKAALSGLKFSKAGVIPVLGVGYENRGETGFLFRMAAYVLIDRSVAPWLGVTFGFAF